MENLFIQSWVEVQRALRGTTDGHIVTSAGYTGDDSKPDVARSQFQMTQ